MKKSLSLCFLLFSLNAIQGQSFLKVRSNIFKFGVPSSQYKLGFGVGHECVVVGESFIKILFAQSLDYKHGSFSYYDGGLGGGTNVFGNINFLNAQIDAKARIGKHFFFEMGLFSSVSLLKKITKGGTITTRRCFFAPNQVPVPVCPPPIDGEITNESKDFGSIDFGGLLGMGYTYKDYTIILDGQFGLKNIVNLPYSQLTTIQFNLSVLKPLKLRTKTSIPLKSL